MNHPSLRCAAATLLTVALLAGCSRSSEGTSGSVQQDQVDQATRAAADAKDGQQENAAAIEGLTTRVGAVETNLGLAEGQTPAIDGLRTDVATARTDLDAVGARVTTLEMSIPVNLDAQLAAALATGATNSSSIGEQGTRLTALEMVGGDNAAALTAQQATIAALEDRLAALEAAQSAGPAYLLGPSTYADDGYFEYAGYAGLRAATAACQAGFPDEPAAHMCTQSEVYIAIGLGQVGDPAATSGVTTWTVTGLSRNPADNDVFVGADSSRTSCLDLRYAGVIDANGSTMTVSLEDAYADGGTPDAGADAGVGPSADLVEVRPNVICSSGPYPVLCCR